MRFVIPRATSSAGVRSTRGFHTRHLPPLGFLNPSTACASADLPVLFHTGATCGIQRTRTIARIASWNDAVDDPAESRWTSQPHPTDQNTSCAKQSSRRKGHEAVSTDPKTRPARPESGLTPRSRENHDPKATTPPDTHAHRREQTPGDMSRDQRTNPDCRGNRTNHRTDLQADQNRQDAVTHDELTHQHPRNLDEPAAANPTPEGNEQGPHESASTRPELPGLTRQRCHSPKSTRRPKREAGKSDRPKAPLTS
jgi:hypothetical protein